MCDERGWCYLCRAHWHSTLLRIVFQDFKMVYVTGGMIQWHGDGDGDVLSCSCDGRYCERFSLMVADKQHHGPFLGCFKYSNIIRTDSI